ncbi:MAG TPA: EF-hand domain-containing protein [Methylotenera sp.]|nr:EF-hand domain-containing protein [Methylotenera sp.]
MIRHTCLTLCVGVGLCFNAAAADKNNSVNADDTAKRSADDGTQQTLNLNFSPEHREKLRKALDDYSRTVDPNHEQIEERRRAMQESIKARFLATDNDNDGTIDRQEATESLPQIARHFSQVDTNQDNVISLDELDDAQTRILERRKAAEAALEAQKIQELEAAAAPKRKSKQASNNPRKPAL